VVIAGWASTEAPQAQIRFCSEHYRETMGLGLTMGRDLTAADVDGMRKVALVNETFARRYFGGNPLGRSVGLSRLERLDTPVADPSFEIVGVIRDVANQGVREAAAPEVYVPYPFQGPSEQGIIVRSDSDPLRLVGTMRQTATAIDRQVALTDPATLDDLIRRFIYAQPRFVLIVLGMFAVTGLLLVALGIYGVLAYTVAQQTRAIAIRMAMGGQRRDVLRLVVSTGLRLVVVGLAIGLLASMGTNRLLESQLWQTSPHDMLTLAAVITTIVLVAVCACWVPARRATRIEPMEALRHE
jgi:putative ABC transport system permease protein